MFDDAIKKYYEIKSKRLIDALRSKGWSAYFFDNKDEARRNVLRILSETGYRKIGVPGSVTIRQIGLIEELEKRGFKVIQH